MSLQCYGCVVLCTVNVEEERIFIPEPLGKKNVHITDDSEGQNPFIPKMQDSSSEIMQCWCNSIFVSSLCGAKKVLWLHNEHLSNL